MEDSEKHMIVGLGECLWDCFEDYRRLGGAPTNFAYYAGQLLGMEHAVVVSAIGNDELGNETLAELDKLNMNHLLPKLQHPTGQVRVTVSDGIPSYDIVEQMAYDFIPWTAELEALAKRTRLVCFGTLAQRHTVSQETAMRFLDTVPDDCLKVFDINLRQHFYSQEVIAQSLQRCNILKLNDEELPEVCHLFGLEDKDPEDSCRAIMAHWHIGTVIYTCGANGSYAFTPKETSFMATPKVDVKDTVAAGDSFGAAFCCAQLNRLPLPQCHRLAVQLSAHVCTHPGAIAPVPASIRNMLP